MSKNFIGGAWQEARSGGTIPTVDPSTGRAYGSIADSGSVDVDLAVTAARAAFDDGRCRHLPPLEQERRLRRLAALIAEHGDELAELDVIDSGLLRMYAGFIVQFAVDGIEVEMAGELLIVRIAGVAAVARTLVIGQETARHGVRNSGLSHRSGHGPRIRHLLSAKVLCGIAPLCDKFRTAAEARA